MPLLPLRAFCLPQHWTKRTYSCLACCGREVTMNYDAPFSPSQLSIITYYYHTLSLRGADNPSSRNHTLRFCP